MTWLGLIRGFVLFRFFVNARHKSVVNFLKHQDLSRFGETSFNWILLMNEVMSCTVLPFL